MSTSTSSRGDLSGLDSTSNAFSTRSADSGDMYDNSQSYSSSGLLKREGEYKAQVQTYQSKVAAASTPVALESNIWDTSKGQHMLQMQSAIKQSIHGLESRTTKLLDNQEKDLIRAFRARLAQVEQELEHARRQSESGSVEWVMRCKKLTEELVWLRDLTDKLNAENRIFLRENKRCQHQLQTQEQDRAFLMKQLVTVKKENARLRLLLERAGATAAETSPQLLHHQQQQQQSKPHPLAVLHQISPSSGLSSTASQGSASHLRRASTERGSLRGPGALLSQTTGNIPAGLAYSLASASAAPSAAKSRPGTSTARGATPQGLDLEVAESLQAENERLRRDLDTMSGLMESLKKENKRISARFREMQAQYTDEKAAKSELLEFLKLAIEDVRVDIAERRAERMRKLAARTGASFSRAAAMAQTVQVPPDPRKIPLEEFTAQDRINVVEWLVSQDRVIFTLYDLLFPVAADVNNAAAVSMTAFSARPSTTHAPSSSASSSSAGVMSPGLLAKTLRPQGTAGPGQPQPPRTAPASTFSTRPGSSGGGSGGGGDQSGRLFPPPTQAFRPPSVQQQQQQQQHAAGMHGGEAGFSSRIGS